MSHSVLKLLYVSYHDSMHCSMSGHRIVSSKVHFYSATKYAVTALTEGIRRELRELNSPVKITVSSMTLMH